MTLRNNDIIERTSVVTYSILDEMFSVLADESKPDETTLGIIMGLAMFLDDKVGPMRSQKLMSNAPGIILKTDAHVTDGIKERLNPVVRAFGTHLAETF